VLPTVASEEQGSKVYIVPIDFRLLENINVNYHVFIRVLAYEFTVYSISYCLYRTTLNNYGGISFNMFPIHCYEKLLLRKCWWEQ